MPTRERRQFYHLLRKRCGLRSCVVPAAKGLSFFRQPDLNFTPKGCRFLLLGGGGMLCYMKKSKFTLWQDQNSEGTFKQFYAEKLSKALNGEKRHASIGPNLKKKGLQKTPGLAAKLVAAGIEPGDVLVDFGCGTLRVGASLIEYLEPDRYVGFDIDQKILDVGREMLPPGGIRREAPEARGRHSAKPQRGGGVASEMGVLEGDPAARTAGRTR